MSKEVKKETDWLGREKWVSYENGEKVGETKRETDWIGREKQVMYDTNRQKVGETRRETDWLGREKFVTYDTYERKVSETRYEKDWLGRSKEVIYEKGQKVGELRREDSIFGTKRKVLYETPSCDVDLARRRTREKTIKTEDGGYRGGYGGSVGRGHEKEPSWIWRIAGLLAVCVIIGLLLGIWSLSSYDHDYHYTGHSGIPAGNISAAPSDRSIVLTPPKSSYVVALEPLMRPGDIQCHFVDPNKWYVNSTVVHSSPNGGKTWYILLTIGNLPKKYHRQIALFHVAERKDGRHLIAVLMGDEQNYIESVDEGRSWRHVNFEDGGRGYVMRQTYDYGETWVRR